MTVLHAVRSTDTNSRSVAYHRRRVCSAALAFFGRPGGRSSLLAAAAKYALRTALMTRYRSARTPHVAHAGLFKGERPPEYDSSQ